MTRLAIIGLSLAFLVFLVWALWPRRIPFQTAKTAGYSSDIEAFVTRLMTSPELEFLIISVTGTADFVQLTADAHGAQIDFPLVTDRQRSHEAIIRQAAQHANLPIHETRGADGSRFLDCDYPGTARETSDACWRLFASVYGLSETTPLTFETAASNQTMKLTAGSSAINF